MVEVKEMGGEAEEVEVEGLDKQLMCYKLAL